MRIGRTLPPAAAPIGIMEIFAGVCGLFHGQKRVDQFQSELKDYFGVKHCFVVSSGKAALTLILLALRELFPNRAEVLIPAFTCYSVPASVIRAGLRISLCDLQPQSFDFNFVQLSAKLSGISPSPKADSGFGNVITDEPDGQHVDSRNSLNSVSGVLAVVATHLFGFPSDVPRLRKQLQGLEVIIVEDAAQAMGEISDENKLGTLGDVSFFSLGRGKAISTVEGGVILTDRADIAKIINRLVERLPHYSFLEQMSLIAKAMALMLFSHPWLFWIPRSIPALRLGETHYEPNFSILKMSSFQAGLTARWRESLEKLWHARKVNVNRWLTILEAHKQSDLCIQQNRSLGLLRLPIRISDRSNKESLLLESAKRGLGVAPVYPNSINHIPELSWELKDEWFPVAERYAKELVTLPTHQYLTQKDIINVARLLPRIE